MLLYLPLISLSISLDVLGFSAFQCNFSWAYTYYIGFLYDLHIRPLSPVGLLIHRVSLHVSCKSTWLTAIRSMRQFLAAAGFQVVAKQLSSAWGDNLATPHTVADSVSVNSPNIFSPLFFEVVPSPDSLTTIHTLAHLALATHMKASTVNDPQVALTTLKLRAHMCP